MSSEKGRRFSHLRWKDRLKIERMLKEGKKPSEIAAALRVHNSTIYREIKRGKTVQRTSMLVDREVYCPDVAENKYRENLTVKGPALKLGRDFALAAYIEDKIANERYSPEAVLLKIKEDGLRFDVTVSKWTLYSYITKGVFLGVTNKNLPRGKRKRTGYRKIRAAHLPKGDSIEERPQEVAARMIPGDWEMDTVASCKKDRARLLVLTERKFRREIIIKMPDGTTQSVVRSLDGLERKLGSRMFRRIFRTITVDNGSEFADCEGMERSGLTKIPRTHVYYCHPYSAFERGSNENANILIRRWLPKGTKLSLVSRQKIKEIENWMNNYPRRVLGGRCANAAVEEWTAEAGIELPNL
uniref:RNaseH n=1 Tax=Caudovirales sp. ctu3532 TaxID=2827639 RepID=A0A8S5TIV5_9CAUD|nr:MAG TPA: RNaseH [Caudovirales sp. ctu3532]